jgi:magnesium chelatase family protein
MAASRRSPYGQPLRAPHYTIADAGVIGGGPMSMPGEVSLAHHGILCLDKLLACTHQGLEELGQLLEQSVLSR